jgi:membrane protease YdiL (CAAX protease family)
MSVVKTSTFDRLPPSPRRWPADTFRWWESTALAVGLIAATIFSLAAVVATLVSFNLATQKDFTTLSWANIVIEIASLAAPLAVLVPGLPAIARRSLHDLGLHLPRTADMLWALGGATAMFVVVTAIGAFQESVVHLKADQITVHWLREGHAPLVASLVVLACIGAPIVEELTFRGFLFNAILRYAPAWLAAALSGALFGLAHSATGVGSIAPLAAGGIVLATVYYRSASLTASILTHAIFNTFTVILVLGFHQQ